MIFDTHTHYDDTAYDEDRDRLLAGLPGQGVGAVTVCGASIESNRKIVQMMELTQNGAIQPNGDTLQMYYAVGIHPTECGEMTEETLQWLRALAQKPRVVAIGEIGLDYYWHKTEPTLQKQWFTAQLALATELDMPVVIHSREAARDTLTMMQEAYHISQSRLTGIIHCFSYSVELAREYLKMGFLIGIGGSCTYKNAVKSVEVIADTPLESIVLETDCPYLTPVPYRGKRNNSAYLTYVAEKIASVKGITREEVEHVTYDNAMRIYRIRE